MNIERIVGLVFSISALLILLFVVLTPQVDYQQDFKIADAAPEIEEIAQIEFEEESKEIAKEAPLKPNKEIVADVANIDRSDFDLFVLRVHVLSSLENAETLSEKIKKGGYPSFVEVFGKNKNLYAIYVGPFLSKEEISSNIEDIKEVSQSSQGEVTRWKL